MSALRISSTAARTACGDGVEQTCASIRAGIVPLREDPRYLVLPADDAPEPQPARTALVRDLDPALDGAARLAALLDPVLAEVIERHEPLRRDAHRAALLLALPAADAVTETWGLDLLARDVAERSGLRFGAVEVSREGHTGVFALLAEAAALLGRGAAELCVLAAVDSLASVPRLRLLDEAGRLRSRRSLDGLFPGEAAAVVVVEPARRLEARGEAGEAVVLGVGQGREPEPWRSDRPSTGRGLTEALRGALGEAAARWGICDFNGELYRGYEWGLTQARLGAQVGALDALTFPARSTGDVGAASGAVALALAAAGWRRRWAPADEAVLWAGADGGDRAAVRVAAPERR